MTKFSGWAAFAALIAYPSFASAQDYGMDRAAGPTGGFELEYVHVQGLEDPRRIGLTLLNSTMEIAAVGPQIRKLEEPHRQAISTGTMAEYRPYCGGSPAIRA